MGFNSIDYYLFLPLVVLCYYLVPPRLRIYLVVIASYGFYSFWKPLYLLLLLASTFASYFSGLNLSKEKVESKRKLWLLLGLGTDIFLLCYFKYLGFFTEITNQLTGLLNYNGTFSPVEMLLPMGISFYTFQSISYTLDVYWGKQKAEEKLINYAAYISFFPQLVAGPIERAKDLIPQFKKKVKFNLSNIIQGGQLILWGLFKKLVVADSLAPFIGSVFSDLDANKGWPLFFACFCFIYQVYCDFSGYSDIAIGSARMLGIKLSLNFDTPFRSKSYSELWSRWHISLTNWLRDYLYLPLGGNRVSKTRWYFNILFVFTLCGLWHGPAWTFVGFGFLHGLTIVLGLLTLRLRSKLSTAIGLKYLPILDRKIDQILVLCLFAFNCIIFRCTDINQYFEVVKALFTVSPFSNFLVENLYLIGLIVLLELFQLLQKKGNLSPFNGIRSYDFRLGFSVFLFFCILLLGQHQSPGFIYFQF